MNLLAECYAIEAFPLLRFDYARLALAPLSVEMENICES